MIRVKIVGPMGYTGGEILRLLLFHPEVEIVQLEAPVDRPTPIVEFLPNLRGVTDMVIENLGAKTPEGTDVVFLAVPNGISRKYVRGYLEAGVRVIDLSGDFRLHDPKAYPLWYKFEHNEPDLLREAAYGLPEFHRRAVRKARLVANPGCYPTTMVLGLGPLTKVDFADLSRVICDCKTAVSGGGRNPKPIFHFPERAENFSAYKITGHQHIPEIEQELEDLAGKQVRVNFTPHLIPCRRGILATIYVDLIRDVSLDDVVSLYEEVYRNERFVRVLRDEPVPSISSVVGSNFCDVGVYLDDRTNQLIVVSMLDNLLKGAAGQAVQNMNIMFDFPEETSLERPGLYI